jgi:hypothetical protein
VPEQDAVYTGRTPVDELTPNHLRLRRSENKNESIARIAKELQDKNIEPDPKKARQRAKKIVEAPGFSPRMVDPSPGKSGLVRDYKLRNILRDEINRRLTEYGIAHDADSFIESDLNKILKEKDSQQDRPLRMPSGVPIKSVVLLRTMSDPVIIPRRRFDQTTSQWVTDEGRRTPRAYVGGSNHHIEIRADEKGRWSGDIVPTYKAARRVRIEKDSAVDRSDDAELGGRFVMSLSQGDVINMRHKDKHDEVGYFVVFKLDKPQTIQFKYHWDARRAKGEKDADGKLIAGSEREAISVTAGQLRDLAPPGETTPIKVAVDPLGQVRRLEPAVIRAVNASAIDPHVMKVAREALAIRQSAAVGQPTVPGRKRRPGSWTWMRGELERHGLAHLAAQLTPAMRLLRLAQARPRSPK